MAADTSLHSPPISLGSFPSEILQNIFYFTTPVTFFQLIRVNRKFFDIASESRELVLHHLRHVPGIKLGLDDRSIATADLFLIFRQRAASHLYGVNFTADCRNLEPPSTGCTIFDPRASCLTVENDSCVAVRNSLKIKLNLHNNAPYGDTIDSPYGDGRAKIIQVVQKAYYVSVLYAWELPAEDPADDLSHPDAQPPTKLPDDDPYRTVDTRDGVRYRLRRSRSKTSSPAPRVRYHLLHYDLFRSDRPIFFPIPVHKSLRGTNLAPVHLAVHNRLQCAILWDLPDTVLPTPHATVCLYKSEYLPRNEPGHYDVWVIWPFDHPAPYHRPGFNIEDRELVLSDSDHDDGRHGTVRNVYTYTRNHQPSLDGGRNRDYDSDLRFLHFPLKPRSLAFFREGRRLSLYAPGSTTPFTTLLANEAIRSRMHPAIMSPSWPSAVGTQWPRSFCRRIRRTNHTLVHGYHFKLSLPFFSHHETRIRPIPPNIDLDDDVIPESDCITNMLCLGTARVPASRIPPAGGDATNAGPEVLTIVQLRVRKSYEDCLHNGSKDDLPSGLPRPPREARRRRVNQHPTAGQGLDDHVITVPDVPAHGGTNNDDHDEDSEPEVEIISDSDTDDARLDPTSGTAVRVVARLWGWNPQSTSLTGLETVSISPRGERIAVAQWDRILIYPLNPGALCEEVWNEDDGSSDGSVSEHGSVATDESVMDQISEVSAENLEGNGSALSVTNSVIEDQHMETNTNLAEGNHNNTNMAEGNHNDSAALPPPGSVEPVLSPAIQVPASGPPPAASVTSDTSTSMTQLVNYYPHVNDQNFRRSVALLQPIVLKMDAGAVVRKMTWGLGRPMRGEGERVGASNEEAVRENTAEEKEVEPVGAGSATEKETSDVAVSSNVAVASDEAGSSDPPSAPCTTEGEETSNQENDDPLPAIEILDFKPQLQSLLSLPPNILRSKSPTAERFAAQVRRFPPLPPAPFADVKFEGQIKHIDRPPEYYQFPDKMTLDQLELLRMTGTPTDSFYDIHSTLEGDSNSDTEAPKEDDRNGKSVQSVDQESKVERKRDEIEAASSENDGREPVPGPTETEVKPNAEPNVMREWEALSSKPLDTAEPAQERGRGSESSPGPQPDQQPQPEAQPESSSRAQRSRSPKPPLSNPFRLNGDADSDDDEILSRLSRARRRRRPRPRLKRIAENELVVMTDRGIQVWDLSVWGTGRRVRAELDVD